MLWTVLIACQEPFDADRHDLLDFRVAALSVSADGQDVQVDAAIVVDGRPWSVDPVALQWGWVDTPDDAIDALPSIDAEGPSPALTRPDASDWLALRAEHGGRVRRAVVQVPDGDVAAVDLAPIEVGDLPWSVADVEPAALQLDARRATASEPDPGRTVGPGGFVRLTLPAPDEAGAVRWMATGGGSFFELEPAAADWAAGDLRLDDDEIAGSRAPIGAGPVTVLALWLADDGPTTAFRADDLYVGDRPDGVFTRGRYVPTDGPPPDGAWLSGRLAADPLSPTGVRLVDAVALAAAPVTFASADWSCAVDVDGPLDPRWLLDQRCTVSDVDGAAVEIEVDP